MNSNIKFGKKLNFKSLSCEPLNELGVVYLFGVLHDVLALDIEAIQAKFPDCIARQEVKKGQWKQIAIEFEFQSSSFLKHGHDPAGVDIIVCWEHNWKECPSSIEVIELKSKIKEMESIEKDIADPKILKSYKEFCREHRLKGLSFQEIAKLWHDRKNNIAENTKQPEPETKKLSAYQQFCQNMKKEGKTFKEISELWKKEKSR